MSRLTNQTCNVSWSQRWVKHGGRSVAMAKENKFHLRLGEVTKYLSLGEWSSTFRRNVLPLSSESSSPRRMECLTPEDEGTAFLQSFGNQSAVDTASHPGRTESAATPLREL